MFDVLKYFCFFAGIAAASSELSDSELELDVSDELDDDDDVEDELLELDLDGKQVFFSGSCFFINPPFLTTVGVVV